MGVGVRAVLEPGHISHHRWDEHTQVYSRPLPEDRWSWSYRREAEHFIACVQSDEPFRSSGEDTLTDVRLFEEVYRNCLEGRGAL